MVSSSQCSLAVRLTIFTCALSVILADQQVNDSTITDQECGQEGDCLQSTSTDTECAEKCGCNSLYIYNETIGECILDFRSAMKVLVKKYDVQDRDIVFDTGMSRKIRIEAEKLFQGILVSAILFMGCAAVCVISACIYCCHINYSDRQLKNNVKALAKKLKKDYRTTKTKRTPLEPVSESCNVVVEEAGLFVV